MKKFIKKTMFIFSLRILLFTAIQLSVYFLPAFALQKVLYAALHSFSPVSQQLFSMEDIKNENLIYNLSFLWFSKAATATVSLIKKNDDEMVATLDAETKGFVGWLLYRRHIYVSHIKRVGKNDLRSVRFERNVITRFTQEKSVNIMNYSNRTLKWATYKDGKLKDKNTWPIPEGIIYEDVLSVFYKFRFGLYGDIVKGKKYIVHTIPENGVTTISISVKSEKEERLNGLDNFTSPSDLKYYVHINLPKEIFGTKKGVVKMWFSADLIPVAGIVKDAIGLGDVMGTLIKKKKTL